MENSYDLPRYEIKYFHTWERGRGTIFKPFCSAVQQNSCYGFIMVICESVKQKECSVRKAKTVYLLWSVRTVEMELLIPWSAQLTPKVTKRKCLHWGLCLKKGPFTSGIPAHLRHSFETFQPICWPGETSSLARIRQTPRRPHCGRQRPPPADTEGILPFKSPQNSVFHSFS